MCGICGLLSESNDKAKSLSLMLQAIAHRGPDDEGTFIENKIALGHRRLSIIDLSKNGHQPMQSADGRFEIVYNGELYNYKDLKLELQRAQSGVDSMAYPFQTQSDTEVILAAYQRWGKDCLKYFNGMFAFAIWDKEKKELFIARDRLGIKPLYYYWDKNKTFAFASEIRALLKSGLVPKKLNNTALHYYVKRQTTPNMHTIIKDVRMLMPGYYAIIKEDIDVVTPQSYWSLYNIKNQPNDKPYTEVTENVKHLLYDSVEKQLASDAPFGAFLSGGIDSSLIVAIMSKYMAKKASTFSINFEESTFDEGPYARQIAKQYNTDHHDIVLSLKLFLSKLPEALAAMDHPSGDGMNSYVVSEATKKEGIKMVLSGLGGDELFAGYPHFKRLYRLEKLNWVSGFPKPLVTLPAHLYKLVKNGSSAQKLIELLNLPNWKTEATYPVIRGAISNTEANSLLDTKDMFSDDFSFDSRFGILSKISIDELLSYIPDTLLRDSDQMSMAHALEVRVPFLDHRLVEYVIGLNDATKFPHTPKKLLTDATKGLLPDNIINRPKMGFTFPWAQWMKGELKTFCEGNMIGLSKRPQFNRENVQSLWHSFLKDSNKTPWFKIWHLVVLENWLTENGIDE